MSQSNYRPVVHLDSHGNPSGFASWEQFRNYLLILPTTNTQKHQLRETEDVLSGCATYNSIKNKWIFSWENQDPMPTSKQHTLLYILRYIKKNRKTLKENSTCFSWLKNKHKTLLNQGRYRSVFVRDGLSASNYYIKRYNDFINDPNYKLVEYTNTSKKPYPSNSLLFSQFLKPVTKLVYSLQDFLRGDVEYSLYYITQRILKIELENKSIIEVDGVYYHTSCFLKTFQTDTSTKYQLITRQTYGLCNNCDSITKKKDLVFREHLDLHTCTPCASHKVNKNLTRDNIITGYHSHSNSWTFFIKRKLKETTLPIGIEIEMQPKGFTGIDATFEIYKQQQILNPNWNEIYFERDGSLYSDGVECISNPMTLDFSKDYWAQMLPVFRKYCTGWKLKIVNECIDEPYGIHLTSNRKYWSNLQLARLIKFVENYHNRKFLQAISQRDFLYGGKKIADKINPKLTDCSLKLTSQKKIVSSTSKYNAINVKETLVEVRMFASTLNQVSFMKNYEFMDAIWHWIQGTVFSIRWEDFIEWLAVQPNSWTRYANLINYLHRPTFFIKTNDSSTFRITNTILPVFQRLNLNKIILTTEVEDDSNHTKDDDQCAL